MKISEPKKSKISIDLTDLSYFLRNDVSKDFNITNHYMQMIEEVVFLCTNRDFISDIIDVRKKILKKYPRMEIPTLNTRKAEVFLGHIYEFWYEPYKKLIQILLDKYKLLPNVYWQDKLLFLDSKIDDELDDARENDEKISKKEARLLALEDALENTELYLLDSIILRNKPFDKRDIFPFWANPYFTRKTNELGGIKINIKKDLFSHLEISFPPYTTLQEMQQLLKDNYKKIQEYREKQLPLPSKRDHRKDNLPKMIDAYMLYINGEDKSIIANFLDARYGGSITFEGVTQLITRIQLEGERFNQNKQET